MLTEEDFRAIEERATTSTPARPRYPSAAEWDRKNLMTITAKLPVKIARRLQAVCLLERTTPYRLLQTYALYWLAAAEARQKPGDVARMTAICESVGWDFRRLRS